MCNECHRIDELFARYELEPSLTDVYVEGKDDEVYKWFFQAKGLRDVKVYPIDTVAIDDKVLAKYGLNKESDQQKVIALAEELRSEFEGDELRVRCVVDADYDRHLGRIRNNDFLEYTDYTSLEMYFFSKPALDKFIGIVLKGLPVTSSFVIKNMAQVLQRVFIIRLSNEKLKWGMSFPKLENLKKYFKWTKMKIEFKEREFIKNYLTKNGRSKQIAEFECVMGACTKQLDADVRHNIRGHDFSWALFHLAKKIKKEVGFNRWEVMERALTGCVEMAFVENEHLFRKLSTL
jgi:hypothetical protein